MSGAANAKRHAWPPALWAFAGLAALLAFNAIFDPDFFALSTVEGNLYGPLVSVGRQAVKVMILAIGMTLVIATGGVDLSVGSIMAVAGSAAALCLRDSAMGFAAAGAIALGGGMLAGTVGGGLVAFARIQPIIATLILMVLGRGVALNLTGAQPIAVDSESLLFLGRGFVLGIPMPVIAAAALLLGAILFTRLTAAGLFVEAVGGNETASRLCGINARTVKLLAYAFSGTCAALAGLISVGDVGRIEPDRLGNMLELDAITAVVVGGTALTGGRFTLVGSIIGAILIQALTVTLTRFGMPSDVAPVPKAVVIVAVCLFQSPTLRARVARIARRRQPA